MKKTKIICTIGPKSESTEILLKLINSGMDVMRLNFSHGNHIEHGNRIKNLRKILKKVNKNIAILLDTKGPEIRTMKLIDNKDVFLRTGQSFIFTVNQNIIGDNYCVAVNYPGFTNDLTIGKIILVDNGLISMKVVNIINEKVICTVLNDGYLGENKGINLPDISIKLPSITEQDKKDLIFGCKQKVDFIAASFIRKDSDVLEIRKYLKVYGGENIQIISKIENQEGLNNFNKILKVSDGIMVARGDLGVEIPIEKVIFAQKMIIEKCNIECKVVITATQMLESMIKNPRPTRAEAGDITNAILDGTDAVMLSGESAKGNYPIESLNIMNTICEYTDNLLIKHVYDDSKLDLIESVCYGIVKISRKIKSKLIVIFTNFDKPAKLIRKYFPVSHILVLTNNHVVVKNLFLSRGIYSLLIPNKILSINDLYNIGKLIALKNKLIKTGDIVIFFICTLLNHDIKNVISINLI